MRWLNRRLWGRTCPVTTVTRLGGLVLEDRTAPAVFRWVSQSSGNFSDPNNWLNETNVHQAPPANGNADLVFDAADPTNGTTANNDLTASTINFQSLKFNVNNFTLTGGSFFTLNTSVTVTTSGHRAIIDTNVGVAAGKTVTVGGAGTVEVTKRISGGFGTLNVTGALLLNNALATGTGNAALWVKTTIASGGSVRLARDYQINTSVATADINVQAGGLLDLAGYKASVGALTGSGNVDLGGNTTSYLAVSSNITNPVPFTFSGVISGAGEVRHPNGPVWTITGANTYTGGTTLSGSRGIQVDGSLSPNGNVTFTSSTATLSGNGSVGQITFTLGSGMVAPGPIGAPGQLTAARLTGHGTFEFHIGGTTPGSGYDQLLVRRSGIYDGSVSLSGLSTLQLVDYGGFVPPAGSSYTLIDNDEADPSVVSFQYNPGSGFVTLAEGSKFVFASKTFQISYRGGDGNDVVITETTPVFGGLSVSSGGGQSAKIDTTFANPLIVTATDTRGQLLAGVTVSLSGQASGTSPGAFFTPTTRMTGNDGKATFTAKANLNAGQYTVTATGVGSGDSKNITYDAKFQLANRAADAATIRIIGGTPQSKTVGLRFGSDLTVELRDAGNNPVRDEAVTFTAPPAGGAGADGVPASAISGIDGRVSLQVSANKAVGSYLIVARIASGASATFDLTNTAAGLAFLRLVSAFNPSAEVGTDFLAPVVLRATDEFGNQLAGVTVTLPAMPAGAPGATFTTPPQTAADGTTQFLPTANSKAGTYPVTALAALGGVTVTGTFLLTNTPGGVTALTPDSGDQQESFTNAPFAQPVTVLATDRFGNRVPGVAVSFAGPTAGASASPSASPVETDADGLAAFQPTANGTPGSYPYTALAGSLPAVFSLTNLDRTVGRVTVESGGGQFATVGMGFGSPVRVRVTNSIGRQLPGVTVTVAGPPTGAGIEAVSLPATDDQGLTDFTPVANTVSGLFTVRVTADGKSDTFSLTNTPGSLDRLAVVAGDNQSKTVGTAFDPVTVRAADRYDNPIPGVQFTVQPPTSGAKAAVTAPSPSGTDGRSSFAATAGEKAGSYSVSVTASLGGVTRQAAVSLANTPGAAARLVLLTAFGQQTVVTTPFAGPVQVRVLDPFDNAVPGETVTFAAEVAVTGASATGAGPVSTDANGDATFTPTANSKAGSYAVTATVGSLSKSVTLTNLLGPVGRVEVTAGGGQSVEVGRSFAAPVTVRVFDIGDNPLGGVGLIVTGPAAGAGIQAVPLLITAADGSASFTPAANTTAGGPFTVSVTTGSRSAALTLENRAGSVAALTVTGGNQSAVVGTTFNTVTVRATDQYGNPIAGLSAVLSGPDTGATATSLPATLTAAADGTAAFTPGAGTVAGSYLIRLTAGGQVADVGLANRPGPVATVTVVSGDGQTAAVGAAFAAPVRLRAGDRYDNPVPGARVTLAPPVSGASVVFTPPPPTDAQGLTQTTATATVAAGSSSVVVTAGGSSLILTFTNTPAVSNPPPGGGGGTGGVARLPREFAAGVDRGGGSVTLYNPDGSPRFSLSPFGGFAGGVRTAAADFTGDGVADLVVGTGPGSPTRVLVYDGGTQAVLFDFAPFEGSFTGGVFVAAGDLTGDGVPELVISPDEGGGPRVRVFNGKGFGQVADFFGIDDPNFRGGARATVGDINGDGVGDLVVAAGFGGGPRVAVFDGTSAASGAYTRRLTPDFFAFEDTLRNGVYVAAGDLDGDGKAELIAGGGPGGGPRVSAFSGAGLLQNTQTRIADFFAGDPDNRGGVRLAVKDLDGDGRADLVAGAGTGAGSRVTAYASKAVVGNGSPDPLFAFDSVPGFSGGVFVG